MFPQLASLTGFIRATILRREVAEGTQFQVVTEWESLEAIRAFSGSDAEGAASFLFDDRRRRSKTSFRKASTDDLT